MSRQVLAWVVAGLLAGLAGEIRADRQDGESQGVVVGTRIVKADAGDVIEVVILTNSGSKQTLLVSPANRDVYATAGQLKTNDKVHVWWTTEGGGKKWVKEIRVRAG